MQQQMAAAMAAFGLLACDAWAAEGPERLQELETVLIVGEQPGPGLWKVSKGEHIMWVLASYQPLPKDMAWRSQKVEARIAESQEVLYSGGISIDAGIGILRGLTLIPAAIKASKIPDKKTLKDVLPAATYGKWRSLRTKYVLKDDDVEKLRPSIAYGQLRGAAFRKSGFGGVNVFDVVGKARKKYKIPRVSTPTIKRTIRIEDPRGILKSAQKLDLPDVECFTQGIDRIESDIERAKTLANAWSRGDTNTLRSLFRNLPLKDAAKESCGFALLTALHDGPSKDAAHAKKMVDDLMWHVEQASLQAQIDWIAAARKAIDKNRTTFAVLSLAEVLSPDGHLAKLRELGYIVEEPN